MPGPEVACGRRRGRAAASRTAGGRGARRRGGRPVGDSARRRRGTGDGGRLAAGHPAGARDGYGAGLLGVSHDHAGFGTPWGAKAFAIMMLLPWPPNC
jgi:hypothetical protein